jgi:hypothetical protein
MRGSTRKRGSAWTAYWDAGDDPATGKRRQKSNGGFKRQKDAEAHLATVIGQVNAGTYVEPTKTTFGAYALQWLDVQRSRLKPSTHESYTAVLTGRVIPELGALPLERVTTSAVDALYAKVLREGRADAKGRLTARSVRYTHTVLRRAMRDAVRKRLIAHDPTDAADPPSPSAAKTPTMRMWSGEQVGRFLGSLLEDRLFAAWRFAASTGARWRSARRGRAMTSCSAGRTARRSGRAASLAPSSATRTRQASRRSGYTISGTRGRRSLSSPAFTRSWCRSASGTRRSRSRWTRTATRCRRCTRTPRPPSRPY